MKVLHRRLNLIISTMNILNLLMFTMTPHPILCKEFNSKRIPGFYGCAEKNLNSLGAYFITFPLITRSEFHGNTQGLPWNDGGFDGIRKVYIGYDGMVTCITFEYNKGNTVVRREHGIQTGPEEEFVLDYPNEVITSVEGAFKRLTDRYMMFALLTFKTSQGRTTSICPNDWVYSDQVKFVLESKGCALVGFYGLQYKSGRVSALGAYYCPLPPPPTDVIKLDAKGGDQGAGAFWEDGVFNGVRNIYLGRSDNGVAYLKFVYDKNTHLVIGDDHGDKPLLEVKEFELEYPSEYITAVEGCYDKVDGSEVDVITMLRFKTNKHENSIYPLDLNRPPNLYSRKNVTKLLGSMENMIHQLGVYVSPITH